MDCPYSHPPDNGREGVYLTDHLEDVAQRVEYIVPNTATTPAGESIREVVKTLAYVHDFGKATTYFQQYIGTLEGTPPNQERYRYHAPIGSFAAYYALNARGFETETCLAGFVAVAKHHGQLPDVAEYVYERAHRRDGVAQQDPNPAEKQQNAIAKQMQNIDNNFKRTATEVFRDATDSAGSWTEFYSGFVGLLGEIEDTVATTGTTPGVREDALSDSCYALVLQCWSALVLADKTSAARAPSDERVYEAERPSAERLTQYVRDLESGVTADRNGSRSQRLNYFRSRARQTVLNNVTTVVENGGGVATLTLPTGMGKTLTGLSAAFELRDRLEGERVVYALPFTSIIDQVVDEVTEIYRTDTAGRLLTAHHHLEETEIRDDTGDRGADEADRDDDVAGMLGESWRAGLTVSTFVQLFESLAGPKNRQSMKLSALHDSVVVLDEPQSLPLDWWKLVPRLVEILTEQYGATVIAMTATQPQLFDNATRLVDEPETYFEATERVSYELDSSAERYISDQEGAKPYDRAADDLGAVLDSHQSVLAVCNTIDSARKLTDQVRQQDPPLLDVADVYADELSTAGNVSDIDSMALAERIESTTDRAVLHLSTRLRPADRLTLIKTAKELTEGETDLAVISTQLVEAGVDISFDQVYRDLAPIDNIVQAAGRCNRSFERDEGHVTVWWLAAPDDQEKTPAEAVYNRDVSLLPVAADALESVRDEKGTLTETAVARTAVKDYYRRLHRDKNVGKDTYAQYVDDVQAEELGRLSLIDQRRSADVLVTRTKSERNLAESVREAQGGYDFERFREQLNETKPLRISVPYYREDSETANAIRELPPLVEDEGIYELDVRQHSDYFDETTGFVVPESSVGARIL